MLAQVRTANIFDRLTYTGYTKLVMFNRRKMRYGSFGWLILAGIFIGTPLTGSTAEAVAGHARVDTIPRTMPAMDKHCDKTGKHNCRHHTGYHSHPMKTGLTNICKTSAAVCYISSCAPLSGTLKVSGQENPHLLLPRVAAVVAAGKEQTDTPYEWHNSTAHERPDPRPPSF